MKPCDFCGAPHGKVLGSEGPCPMIVVSRLPVKPSARVYRRADPPEEGIAERMARVAWTMRRLGLAHR